MSEDKVILHYLTESRASRIVWLLEELGIKYEVKIYQRTKEYLAPPELKKVWPLGLSPVVEVYKSGDPEPIVLAESGLIVSYLIKNYDTESKFTAKTERDQVLVDYYLHFSEGTLQPHIVSLLVGFLAIKRAPPGSGWLVKIVMTQINKQFYLKKIMTALAFLNSQLEKKGGGYFVGDTLTGADFILDFPINNNVFSNPDRFKEFGASADPHKEYPFLSQWNKLTTERELYKKATQVEQDLLKNKGTTTTKL